MWDGEIGQRSAGRPQLQQDGAERREVVGGRAGDQVPPLDRVAAGHGEVIAGIVVDDRVMHRTDERQVVGLRGGSWKGRCSARRRGQGTVVSIGLKSERMPVGGVRLHVPGILMRGAAFQGEDDQVLRPRGRIVEPAASAVARIRSGSPSPSIPAPPTRRNAHSCVARTRPPGTGRRQVGTRGPVVLPCWNCRGGIATSPS